MQTQTPLHREDLNPTTRQATINALSSCYPVEDANMLHLCYYLRGIKRAPFHEQWEHDAEGYASTFDVSFNAMAVAARNDAECFEDVTVAIDYGDHERFEVWVSSTTASEAVRMYNLDARTMREFLFRMASGLEAELNGWRFKPAPADNDSLLETLHYIMAVPTHTTTLKTLVDMQGQVTTNRLSDAGLQASFTVPVQYLFERYEYRTAPHTVFINYANGGHAQCRIDGAHVSRDFHASPDEVRHVLCELARGRRVELGGATLNPDA